MKRRSAASSKPPESPVFFLDRSLGSIKVARALTDNGCIVRVHDDLFAQHTPDEVWLAEAGKRGWIVLTRDKRIRHRAIEIEALLAHGVRAFVLASGSLTGEASAQIFVRAIPEIRRTLEREAGALVASVTANGSVHILRRRSR